MLLAYVDETYDINGLDYSPPFGEFALFCLLVNGKQALIIREKLDEITRSLNQKYPKINKHIRFHGYHMINQKKDWNKENSGLELNQIEDVFKEAVREIIRLKPIIASFVINCNSETYRAKGVDPPYLIALKMLVEQIERNPETKDKTIIPLFDTHEKKEKYRLHFRDLRTTGTGGDRPHYAKKFTEPHYVDSHENRLLQAVDLIAYTYRKAHITIPMNEDVAKEYKILWEEIEKNCTPIYRCWPPKTDKDADFYKKHKKAYKDFQKLNKENKKKL